MAAANGTMPQIQQTNRTPIVSPNGAAVAVSNVSVQAIGSNISRRGLWFLNPGAVEIYICPANLPAVVGQGIPILPGAGPFKLEAADGMGSGGSINAGWNAIAASAGTNYLTVLEFL